jgi:hypothetical protein
LGETVYEAVEGGGGIGVFGSTTVALARSLAVGGTYEDVL